MIDVSELKHLQFTPDIGIYCPNTRWVSAIPRHIHGKNYCRTCAKSLRHKKMNFQSSYCGTFKNQKITLIQISPFWVPSTCFKIKFFFFCPIQRSFSKSCAHLGRSTLDHHRAPISRPNGGKDDLQPLKRRRVFFDTLRVFTHHKSYIM